MIAVKIVKRNFFMLEFASSLNYATVNRLVFIESVAEQIANKNCVFNI